MATGWKYVGQTGQWEHNDSMLLSDTHSPTCKIEHNVNAWPE